MSPTSYQTAPPRSDIVAHPLLPVKLARCFSGAIIRTEDTPLAADSTHTAVLAPVAARRRRWYAQLWIQVLIAMAAGILLGAFRPDTGARMQPLGDAFIKAIRMLITPIIFCTVVHGVARMVDVARVGRVALKAIVYFEVLTTIALVIGLAAVNLWKPGMNVDLPHVDTSAAQTYIAHRETASVSQFLMNIIPNTLVGAFTEGNVLQVLLISVLCAFALLQIGARGKPVVDFIEAVSKMLFGVVRIVMWTAPIGAFGAIAFAVGKFGATSLVSLG